MAFPKVSDEKLRRSVELLEEVYRDGFEPGRGAATEAVSRGMAEGLYSNRVQIHQWGDLAKLRLGLKADESFYRPRQYQHRQPGSPVVPSQDHIAEPDPEDEPIRVAVIGDAHDSPHLPNKERFRWLGAYIAERGIERVVSVGDWWTMDCFSTYTDRATFEGRAKPTFDQDRDSFHESQRAFQEGLAGHKPIKLITLGNHEARAWKYDNFHPDGISHGDLVDEAFLQWGWRTAPYGEYRFIGGVGFTHIPFNAMGRPLAQTQRANKALVDTIHGDDHRATQITDFKSGPFRSPTIYSAATALPPGFIEGFANKGGSTWRSGICEAVVWGGHVRSWSFCEMILLRRRYGARLAA